MLKGKRISNIFSFRGSGVARVPCALGQKIFLPPRKKYSCPPSSKLTEFELRNSCKNAEEAKAEHLL